MEESKKEGNLKFIEALLSSFSTDELKQALKRINEHLEKRENLFQIPVEIFSLDLAPAESLVKFLKENKKLDYHEIAETINRDERGIWSTYRRAKQKRPSFFSIPSPEELIPVDIFKNRKFSILESLLLYLIDKKHWKVRDAAKLLRKSYSTVYTTYRRAKQKRGKTK